MEDQVLSIEQMQELKALGIDTSKASMCWVASSRTDYSKELPQIRETTLQVFTDIRKDIWLNKETYRVDDIIPTFTLQDILEILPNPLNVKTNKYPFTGVMESYRWFISGDFTMSYIGFDNTLKTIIGDSLLEVAFEMLKWCKQSRSKAIENKK